MMDSVGVCLTVRLGAQTLQPTSWLPGMSKVPPFLVLNIQERAFRVLPSSSCRLTHDLRGQEKFQIIFLCACLSQQTEPGSSYAPCQLRRLDTRHWTSQKRSFCSAQPSVELELHWAQRRCALCVWASAQVPLVAHDRGAVSLCA